MTSSTTTLTADVTRTHDLRMVQTVRTAAAAYLKHHRTIHHPSTRNSYRTALLSFADHAGQRPLDRIGPNLIEEWLYQPGWAPATRRGYLSHLNQFFRWCQHRRWVRTNPCDLVRRPRQPRRTPRALTHEQAQALYAACPDQRARTIITLMLQQGLRCVEVARLEAGDLDWRAGTMRVVGKGDHERILPLLEPTRVELRALGVPQTGPVIRSHTTGEALRPHTISRLVAELCWSAGIKTTVRDGVSAHAARHTTATDMLLRGAHLVDVSAALGHAHLSSTQVYLPRQVDGLAAAMDGRDYQPA